MIKSNSRRLSPLAGSITYIIAALMFFAVTVILVAETYTFFKTGMDPEYASYLVTLLIGAIFYSFAGVVLVSFTVASIIATAALVGLSVLGILLLKTSRKNLDLVSIICVIFDGIIIMLFIKLAYVFVPLLQSGLAARYIILFATFAAAAVTVTLNAIFCLLKLSKKQRVVTQNGENRNGENL